jgi:DNA repair exonuclease SbcCD nuclease subunit
MVLLTGDYHLNATSEIQFINKSYLKEKYKSRYNKITAHIILGDGGFMWPKVDMTDHYKWIALRSFPTFVVFGNHDNYDAILKCPLVDKGVGELVYQVTDSIFYLQRGKIYTFEDKKYLVLGGGLSVDKMYRKEGSSWWSQEYWSKKEMQDLRELLHTNNTFDYVISHTGPNSICRQICVGMPGLKDKIFDEVAIFYDEFLNAINFNTWLFGHYHEFNDWTHPYTHKRFIVLYKQHTALINDDQITVSS